jgi:hypothetical protein
MRGTVLVKPSSNCKLQTRQRGHPITTNPHLYKEHFKEKEKLVMGPHMVDRYQGELAD